ncbi:MAG: MFS transporter [Dermabacter sp.]|nr:MFS transporter [Dermabacter sp.]
MTDSVWRLASFRWIIASQGWALTGTVIGNVAIPLVAVTVLGAGAFELSMVSVARYLPNLLFSALLGIQVDRLRLRRAAVAADWARAAILAIIPLAWMAGHLNLWLLIGVSAALGTVRIVFDLALSSAIPLLIPEHQRKRANASFETLGTIANVAGPGLGGLVVAVIGAPLALLVNAVTYVASALCLRRLPEPERPPTDEEAEGRKGWQVLGRGFVELARQPVLVALIGAGALSNMALMAFQSVYFAYALEQWGLSEFVAAAILVAVAFGTIVGNLAAEPWSNRTVARKILMVAFSVGAVGSLPLLVLTQHPGAAIALLVTSFVLWGFAFGVSNVISTTYRQKVIPAAVMGRVLGAARTLVFGAFPFGAAAGGVVAGQWGFTGVAVLNVALNLVAVTVLILGLRHSRATELSEI